MADNVTFTTPSFAAATDEVTGTLEHIQLMKLAIAADGSRTLIPADGTDGLLVNLGANNDVAVTGTVTANLAAGTNNIGDVDVLSIAAGDNNIGNVDIVTVPAPLSTTGTGTEATALRVTIATDSTGVLSVDDNNAALTVDNGGTFAVQVDGAALTALQLIDNPVFADEASFTVGSSSVNVAGFLADDASADLAAEGQAVAARTTLDRKQVVMLGESGANLVRGGGSKTDTTDQSIMGAVASKYNYLHWVAVYNASSTNTYVNVKDGSTVVAVLPLPAYGGAVFNLPVPIRSTVNTAINLATGASVTTAYLYGGGYVGY